MVIAVSQWPGLAAVRRMVIAVSQWPGLAAVRRMVIAVSQWPGLAVGGGNGDSRVTVAWFGCGWGEW